MLLSHEVPKSPMPSPAVPYKTYLVWTSRFPGRFPASSFSFPIRTSDAAHPPGAAAERIDAPCSASVRPASVRKVGEMCDIHPSIPTHARLALSPCNSIIPIRRAEQNSACNEKTGNTKRTLDFASSLRRAFPVPNDSDEAQSQHLP